jgi:hypothetical protein
VLKQNVNFLVKIYKNFHAMGDAAHEITKNNHAQSMPMAKKRNFEGHELISYFCLGIFK